MEGAHPPRHGWRNPRQFGLRDGSPGRRKSRRHWGTAPEGRRFSFSDSVGRETMAHKSDQEKIEQTRNVPRFFLEHPQVSCVLVVGVLIWGWFGYKSMPQRKDPNIPVRVALASCSCPGATAQQVEQLVTRPIEDTVAQNTWIHAGTPADFGVRSISLPGYSYVYIQLVDNVDDLKRQRSEEHTSELQSHLNLVCRL